MQWLSNDTRPVEGQLRYVQHFAWLPTQVNQTKVWFESYYVLEKYVALGGPMRGYDGWIDLSVLTKQQMMHKASPNNSANRI